MIFLLGSTVGAQPPETSPSLPQEALPHLEKIRRPWNPLLFSEGYVLGNIVRPASEGIIIKFFNSEIFLGKDSIPAQLKGKPVNPFYVSSYYNSWRERMSREQNETMSMLRVEGYLIHPFLHSRYAIDELIPVNSRYQLSTRVMDVSERFRIYRHLYYGVSEVEGRVVMATLDGVVVRKRYRLLVQLGDGGGRFIDLNVSHRDLFDYIIQTMATGLPVRVSYYTLYAPEAWPSNLVRGYETNTRVFRVEVLGRAPRN